MPNQPPPPVCNFGLPYKMFLRPCTKLPNKHKTLKSIFMTHTRVFGNKLSIHSRAHSLKYLNYY